MELPPPATLSTSIGLFFVALTVRAIFSFLETSITALRLFNIKELAATTKRYGRLLQTLEKNPHRVLITILIANSLADVTTAALATHIMETFFSYLHLSSALGFSLGIGFATIAILIFGEIIPKNLAKGRGESLFKSSLWLINAIFWLMYPVVTFLIRFSDFFISKLGDKKTLETSTHWIASEKEIQFLIEYINEKGLMEKEKTEMLKAIFELGRTHVKEIMVPETDIVSVNIDDSIAHTLQVFAEHRFTRLPVYEKQNDNIVGMIHLKDIFIVMSQGEEKSLKDLMRPIVFVPESLKINQLLREFRQNHMHIAIVLNEHGSIIGLIALEDILEEIVGEISDEHEPNAEKIVHLKQGGWLVDAGITLEELEDFLTIGFVAEESNTLGGFLTEKLQHLPKKGERVLYKGFYFQIQKASSKRVLQVLVFEENNTAHQNPLN